MAGAGGGTGTELAEEPIRHHVGLSSTGVFVISVAIQAIGVAASVALNHVVGGNDAGKAILGTVQLYLLIASSINGIGDLRIGTAYTFFVARGRPASELTGTYLALRLAMVGIGGVSLFVLGTIPGSGFQWASTGEEIEALSVFMVLPILWSIQTVYTQMVVAGGRSVAGQIPLLLESCVRTPLLIAVVFLDPTVTGLTLAYVPGALASALYCLRPVLRETYRFQRAEAMRLFRYAWPLMGSLLLLYLANSAPPLIVNAYLGTIQLAEFSAANGWRILALSLPAAVAVPLFPVLTALHKAKGAASVRASTWTALRYTAMVVVPGVLAIVVYRNNLLNIFANATYIGPASLPLVILGFAVIPAALAQIIGTSLNAVGYQRLELYLTSLQVAVLFGGSILLLPPYSLFGLAGLVAISLSILGSSVAALVVNAYFMHRLLAVRIQLRPIGGILLSAAAAFFAVSRLNTVLAVGRWYELVLVVALGFAVYFGVLALIGELSKEDVRYLSGSIGLPATLRDTLVRLCWRERAPPVNEGVPTIGEYDEEAGTATVRRRPPPPLP